MYIFSYQKLLRHYENKFIRCILCQNSAVIYHATGMTCTRVGWQNICTHVHCLATSDKQVPCSRLSYCHKKVKMSTAIQPGRTIQTKDNIPDQYSSLSLTLIQAQTVEPGRRISNSVLPNKLKTEQSGRAYYLTTSILKAKSSRNNRTEADQERSHQAKA